MLQRQISVRYTSQPLCSPHSLQRLAACYSVLGLLFKRRFSDCYYLVTYAIVSDTFIGLQYHTFAFNPKACILPVFVSSPEGEPFFRITYQRVVLLATRNYSKKAPT